MNYADMLQSGIGVLKQLVPALSKNGAPADVINAVTAAVAALEQHWNDPVTKANLEKLRG